MATVRSRGSHPATLTVPASAAAILRALLAVSLAICAVSAITQTAEVLGWENPSRIASRVLDVDEEQSLGAWWSSCILFVGAAVVTSIAASSTRQQLRRGWLMLSAVLVLISLDETIAVHEEISVRLRSRFDTSGLLHHAWIIPASFVLVALALLSVRFLRELPATTRRLLLVASGLFVAGGLGLEAVGGPIKNAYGEQSLPYLVPTHLEEFLEMAGAALLLYALLTYRESARSDAPIPGPE